MWARRGSAAGSPEPGLRKVCKRNQSVRKKVGRKDNWDRLGKEGWETADRQRLRQGGGNEDEEEDVFLS